MKSICAVLREGLPSDKRGLNAVEFKAAKLEEYWTFCEQTKATYAEQY